MNDLLAKIGLSTELVVKFAIGFGIIILVFLVAKIIANIIGNLVSKATFINKAFKIVDVELNMKKIGNILSKILYYVFLLIGIVAGLAYAGVVERTAVNGLINNYVMNFINAGILALVAWFLAVLAKSGVKNLVNKSDLSKDLGSKDNSFSETLGTVTYSAVILFFISPILEKLGQKELTKPITDIVDSITNFLPKLLAVVIIFTISYFVAKMIKKIIINILSGLGFDKILGVIGLKNINSKTTPSEVVGTIVFSYILLLAGIEAANSIGFTGFSTIINNILIFATNILIGVIILGIGAYIANLIADLIKSTTKSKILPNIAKVAIIVLTGFMGLKQMQIGGEIIDQAFTLILGAIAVAFALAVGLGSKEVAGAEIKKLIDNLKK